LCLFPYRNIFSLPLLKNAILEKGRICLIKIMVEQA
jgi:hypothetical protein